MTLAQVTSALILVGALLMLLAIVRTAALVTSLRDEELRRGWRILLIFMTVFFVGYLGCAYLALSGRDDWLMLLTGGIFLGGAAFVLQTVRLGIRSIDELRKSNLQLRQVATDANAANIAKSRFLANMSHELRTPLNAIRGYTELIEEVATDCGYQEIITDTTRIRTASDQLLSIISDVLDISRIEAGKESVRLSRVDVPKLFDELRMTVDSLLDDTTLEVRIEDDLRQVVADEQKLRQILLNLLGNACKFTEAGTISLSASRRGDETVFAVADTGIGIASEALPSLFDAFTQVDDSPTRRHGGTGLGLTLCKRFVDMMDGRIEVESTPGEGSTFRVCLPPMECEEDERQDEDAA